MKSPYKVIKSKHVTEKAQMLRELHTAESNPCLRKCENPKEVFVVELTANKAEIAQAIEEIYKEQKVKVLSVNTSIMKPKPKRRGKGRKGQTKRFKKAIVTLEKGDVLEDV